MGMSASQARLLSLMARMSDVEYEGQQINQQRLVLSNKMNEVMEKMTNMDVPTPPSKQDFLYNEYSGKTRNGKKISATMNDDGTFNIEKDVAGLIVEDAGLQNITNGSQINGTPVDSKTLMVQDKAGFHDCKGGEEATAHRAEKPIDDATKFEKYKENEWVRYYADGAGTRKKTTTRLADSPDGKKKAVAYSGTAKVKVPLYKYTKTQDAGHYVNGTNYGIKTPTLSKINYEQKWDEETQSYVDDTSRVKSYEYSTEKGTYTHNSSTEMDWQSCRKNEEGQFDQDGYEEVSLTLPISENDFQKYVNAFDARYSTGKVDFNNVTNTDEANAALENGFKREIRQGGAVMGDVLKYQSESNSKIDEKYFDSHITECSGCDPAGAAFVNDGRYLHTPADGRELEGAFINKHNTEVDENMKHEYFYLDNGKFKKCSASEAKNHVPVYQSVQDGIGITDQILDESKLTGMYIYDTSKNAYLIGDTITVEDAVDRLTKGGWKLMKKDKGGSETFADAANTSSVTVNGCSTKPVTEMVNNNDKKFQDALTGLQQSFPDDWEKFSVIIDSSDTSVSYSFCRTDELVNNAKTGVDNQVRVYVPGHGTYQETIENCEATYDENGYLESVKLPNGELVKMSIEQKVDEVEYDAAMNKYNIKKIEYDKEVNELNKQTSIYQRQDKTLELKLTRLDTERNALNTEIDAVKKVIQDATEKGFKTFSG